VLTKLLMIYVSGFLSFSPNNMSRRHIGHLKPVDLSPFSDDVIYHMYWLSLTRKYKDKTKMATSTSVDKTVDDLLTCTICLETLKVPKYLPCLHTFCETCIHTYITSSEKGDKSTGFKCPICRRLCLFTVTYTSVFL
jgi:hypothetical protein